MPANVQSLLLNPAFYFALYAVVQLIVLQFAPQVSPDLWKAIDALVAVVIGSLTGTKIAVTHSETVRRALGVIRDPRLPLLCLCTAVLVLSFLIISPSPAYADSPQPYVYALVKCSGLPVATLVKAEQQFDSDYGWTHQLTTPAQWQGTFESRVNEFAALLGCTSVFDSGQLTPWYRWYVPVYQRILQEPN